jgi:DNA-binding IclR family transcriptional regulator
MYKRSQTSEATIAIMSGEDRKSGGIQSLARASAILNAIVRHRGGIGLAQLSKIVGLHSSTTFHLVKTLGQLGYVRQDPVTKLYRVGRMVFDLASTAFDEVEMANVAAPYLDELALRTGGTGYFAVRAGGDIVVLAKSEGTGAFRTADRASIARPAHATALGKMLLSSMTAENLEIFLSTQELRALTDRTIVDPEKFRAEMARIRSAGVAYDEGEFHPELRCVAVPIFNFTGHAVASLALSTAVWRLTIGDLKVKASVLRSLADRLSAEFGYRAEPEAQPEKAAQAPLRGKQRIGAAAAE